MKKIPKSVLVIVYTKDKKVLLLKKKDNENMWQSVGMLNAPWHT